MVYSPRYWQLQGKVDMSVAIVPMSAEAGWSASVSGLVQVGYCAVGKRRKGRGLLGSTPKGTGVVEYEA